MKKLLTCHNESTASYVAEVWTLWKNRSEVLQKFLNAVLKKNGDQLGTSFEKLKYYSIAVKKERKKETAHTQ
jgi:hypothetical protein